MPSTWLRRLLAAMLALGAILPCNELNAQQGYSPEVGQQHAEILLPRIDTREPVSLSQFRGKKVLLVHFASW